jgi:translin
MSNLLKMSDEVIMKMKELEDARNVAIACSRLVIRSTKTVIHSLQIGAPDLDAIKNMDGLMKNLIESVKKEPEILHSGVVEDAMMEYAEARLFIAIINNKNIPSYIELDISPQSWAMGLCDALGELRRLLLTRLMASDLNGAKDLFSRMEEVSDTIMIFDVPDAIAPIRRKQDAARGIMEKTRSDMTAATMILSIQH